MRLKIAMIPHLPKLAVSDLPKGWHDPSDPPLSAEAHLQVPGFTLHLERQLLGGPLFIATASLLRCRQTARFAIERFGNVWGGGCPVITLESLGQPDNGEPDPENPVADEKGLVYYGQRTSTEDWVRMCAHSISILGGIAEKMLNRPPFEVPEGSCVWVFTTRPLAAAARFIDTAFKKLKTW